MTDSHYEPSAYYKSVKEDGSIDLFNFHYKVSLTFFFSHLPFFYEGPLTLNSRGFSVCQYQRVVNYTNWKIRETVESGIFKKDRHSHPAEWSRLLLLSSCDKGTSEQLFIKGKFFFPLVFALLIKRKWGNDHYEK